MPSAFHRHGSAPFLTSLLLALIAAPAAFGDSVNTKERTVTKLAEGVYEIRHPDAPDTFPQGNTTVIIGDKEVLVVDSCYLPSSAREDIAQIRQWTNKPVRYLLNTHWHNDHVQGNTAYADAFPSLAIIARSETQKQIAEYVVRYFERFPNRAAQFKKMIETGKDERGEPLTEIDKRDLKNALAGLEPVGAELRNLVLRLPNLTFDRELDIDLGNREVQVKFLGRGNTAGDAVAYLPRGKILIAGDLLDSPVPYLGGGYPSEEIATLEKMAQVDAETIVPGHGDILHGKAYLYQVIALLKTVVSEVSEAIYRLGNGPRKLEAVKKEVQQKIDLNALRQQFAGDDIDNRNFFDTFSLPGLIEAAYAELWPR
jgi:cyclase